MDGDRDRLRRRDFLGRLAAGLVLGALPGCAAVFTYEEHLINGRISLNLNDIPQDENGFRPLRIHASEIAGGLILIPVSGEGGLVSQGGSDSLSNGSFRALSAKCTHLGCQVRASQNFLTCPCHGSTFDVQGKVVRGPAKRPLPSYPVEVRNGRIEIIVS